MSSVGNEYVLYKLMIDLFCDINSGDKITRSFLFLSALILVAKEFIWWLIYSLQCLSIVLFNSAVYLRLHVIDEIVYKYLPINVTKMFK